MKKINFKRGFGWSEVLSLIAILMSGYLYYLQYLNSKEKISFIDDKSYYCYFIDKDGKEKYFHVLRGIAINNGNKPVTLLGLQPAFDINSLFIGTLKNTNKMEKLEIPHKIFKIPDSISLSSLFKNDELLWNFKNQGKDKFSIINKHLSPGEAYYLNIGFIIDIKSNPSKIYEDIFFISELNFSNNQKINFSANVTIR